MISNRIYAFCLLSLLAGCSTQQPPAEPVTNAEELFTRPVMAESVLRQGSRLQLALALADGGAALVALDCVDEQAELLFLEGDQRVYPGRVNGYAASLALSAAKVEALKQRPDVAALCAQPASADWRVLASGAGGDTLVIDRNSLVDANGVRRFWGGQQLPVQLQTPRYGAPVRQWRESLAADCTARRYLLLARYGLDDAGRITDSQPGAQGQETFAAAPVERRTLLEAACDRRDALLATPRLGGIKAAATTPAAPSPAGELPAAQAQPLQALKALALPPPAMAVQRFVEAGESRYEGQTQAYREEVRVSPGAQPGLLRFSAQGRAARVDSLNWRGLIDLVRRTRLDNGNLPVEELASLDRLSFSGDWRRLAVGSQVGYQARQTLTGNLKGAERREIKLSCKVVGEGEARKVLGTLSGRAKTLECRHGISGNGPLSRWTYLEAYGLFHLTSVGAGQAMGLEKQLSELQ